MKCTVTGFDEVSSNKPYTNPSAEVVVFKKDLTQNILCIYHCCKIIIFLKNPIFFLRTFIQFWNYRFFILFMILKAAAADRLHSLLTFVSRLKILLGLTSCTTKPVALLGWGPLVSLLKRDPEQWSTPWVMYGQVLNNLK